MSIKDGKKPLSQKTTAAPITSFDAFGNTLAIPADVQAELDQKGLVGRWINGPKTMAQGGYNARGWEVYKRSKVSSDIIYGSSPDGTVRRGDCILAVKPKEAHDKHKAFLEFEADKKKGAKSKYASELRKALAANGLSSVVEEGYDDNE